MRIAIATWNARRVGGVEEYLHALIPALRSAGHDVALVVEQAAHAGRAPIVPDDMIPTWEAGEREPVNALAAVRAWEPDVVYAHGLTDPHIEAALLDVAPGVLFAHGYYGTCITGSKTLRWPVARPCPHGFTPACLVRYYPRRIGGANPLTLAREYRLARARHRLLGEYAAIVTHSEHLRDEFRRHVPAPDRVHAVPFFVAPPPGPPPDAPPPPPWRLLFVGRMTDLKGGQLALEALPIIADALGSVHLGFVGDGPDRREWQAEAARIAGADPRLTTAFEGWLTGAPLERAWALSHLLVMPSVWPEPFGMVGVEAGQRRRPAAAFDVGGIRTWLTPGENGCLAPGDPPTAEGLAAAIMGCLRDPARYAALALGAAAAAERFTAERHLAALLPLLEHAAA